MMRNRIALSLTCTLLLLLMAPGCGIGDDDATTAPVDTAAPIDPDGAPPPPPYPQPDGGSPPLTEAGTPLPGPGDPPPDCTGFSSPEKRDYTLKLQHDGKTRTAIVHIPLGYDGSQAVGLVFNNHGSMCSAKFQAKMSHLDESADKRNLVTVTPQGTGGLFPGWNVGESPMGYVYTEVDDVGFFNLMIDELQKTICIDPKKIFCTGFSLGGSMCYRLSCDLSDRIAAIASVSGPDGTVTCEPKRAVPLLHIHGTADSWASYEPDLKTTPPNKGAEAYVANHAKRSGCSPDAKVTLTQGDVTCKTYSGCSEGVEATLCTVKDGGHTWPGGDGWLLGGKVNKDINASEMILDFFLKYPLP